MADCELIVRSVVPLVHCSQRDSVNQAVECENQQDVDSIPGIDALMKELDDQFSPTSEFIKTFEYLCPASWSTPDQIINFNKKVWHAPGSLYARNKCARVYM